MSHQTLHDHAFTVTGSEVTEAKLLDKPTNLRWQITVKPDSNSDVTVVLPSTTDCRDRGSICTKNGGRPLSNKLQITLSGS